MNESQFEKSSTSRSPHLVLNWMLGSLKEKDAEIERLRELVEAGKEDRKSIDELVDENERLRGLLKGVVDDMVVGDDWYQLWDEIKREVGDE